MDYNILIVNGNLLPVGLENEKNTDRIKRKKLRDVSRSFFLLYREKFNSQAPKGA